MINLNSNILQNKTFINYSAKTMFNIIKKYVPETEIKFPTRRKYLLHFLKTDKRLKNIELEELDVEEKNLCDIFSTKLEITKNQMIDWIKNKKSVIVNIDILKPRYPNDPCFQKEFKQQEQSITKIMNEYVIVDGFTYKIDPCNRKWSGGRGYIEYID